MATAAIGCVGPFTAFGCFWIDDLPVFGTRRKRPAARRVGNTGGGTFWRRQIFREVIRYGFKFGRSSFRAARDHAGDDLAPTFPRHAVTENYGCGMARSTDSLNGIATGCVR